MRSQHPVFKTEIKGSEQFLNTADRFTREVVS